MRDTDKAALRDAMIMVTDKNQALLKALVWLGALCGLYLTSTVEPRPDAPVVEVRLASDAIVASAASTPSTPVPPEPTCR